MKKSDYEMREVMGVGWLAHRRRVGTKILILCAVSGFASMVSGFYLGNSIIIVAGMTVLVSAAALASF